MHWKSSVCVLWYSSHIHHITWGLMWQKHIWPVIPTSVYCCWSAVCLISYSGIHLFWLSVCSLTLNLLCVNLHTHWTHGIKPLCFTVVTCCVSHVKKLVIANDLWPSLMLMSGQSFAPVGWWAMGTHILLLWADNSQKENSVLATVSTIRTYMFLLIFCISAFM